MRAIAKIAVLLLLSRAGIVAEEQVTVRQGIESPPAIQNFESPMVLDLAMPGFEALDSGKPVALPNVRKYICDRNVSLQNLALAKQASGRGKSRAVVLVLSGGVFVAESYDRRVDLTLRLKSGEARVATQVLRDLSTEERRTTQFRVLMPIEEGRLSEAYAAPTPPVLEVTLTVRDNS